MTDREQPGRAVSGPAGHGALRVSHEDRDQVAEALRVAAGDGRLTGDELDERLERALTARTFDDLAVLVADLPAAGTSLAPLPGAVTAALPGAPVSGAPVSGAAVSGAGLAPARDLVKIDCFSGQAERAGRWAVPARMVITATSGQVRLDFTEAVISQPTLHIDVTIHSSQLTLVTRPGIVVNMDDVSVHSSQVKIREPWGDSVPVFLHVTVAGTCSSGVIAARPPRRTFWQWLRRAPRPYTIAA
jgi:Domain of unknown function (DUF1707)